MESFWAAADKKGDRLPLISRRNVDQGVLVGGMAEDWKLVSGVVEG